MAFLKYFIPPISLSKFEGRIELVRILFGIHIAYRYLDILGHSVLSPAADKVMLLSVLGAFLGAAIAVGFLTPLCIMWLFLKLLLAPPFAGTLGDQIAIVNCWVLLLSGAGKHSLSVDSRWLPSGGWTGKFKSLLYGLSVFPSEGGAACVRFCGIAMFWAISFCAMAYHFKDPLWLEGKVLDLLYTMPFMSSQYETFRLFQSQAPELYSIFCKLGLVIQGVWELLLLPLMFFKPGRWFVRWQGLGFFVVSFITINLGYLPLQEMLFWHLCLNYSAGKVSVTQHKEGLSTEMSKIWIDRGPSFQKSWSLVVCSIVGVMAISFTLLSTASVLGGSEVAPLATGLLHNKGFRYAGMSPVEVFNREDMQIGNHFYVLAEVDPVSGLPEKVLPFLDSNGGRLSYLRNDFTYFSHSLSWHRAPAALKLPDNRASKAALVQFKRLVHLHRCITGEHRSKSYRVYFFERSIVEAPAASLRWSKRRYLSSDVFHVETSSDDSLACRYAYDLPPGHSGEARRAAKTLKVLQRLHNRGAVEALYPTKDLHAA